MVQRGGEGAHERADIQRHHKGEEGVDPHEAPQLLIAERGAEAAEQY